ncbi:cyclopropane-fatty-acyl-phospholipid synthase [Folsomia candida]|uniref:cyclopropane-fatty-acyl-phospholipid synthase n=1 Tax=Folsomia candida TaxID=158441 RepID=UPI000B906426|nr:cyclopropane-fatty-acyl-phospholipid synthase [Folsomia candida]XP_035700785.1 cyclopropane-fatty-acyl-phospholipid synthase [Folsomia candida]
MNVILNTVEDIFVTVSVPLYDTIVPIFRKVRFFILLPFTPILKLITDHAFARIGVTLDSDMKSHPDMVILDKRFYARLWSDQLIGLEEMYVDEWWKTENIQLLFDKIITVIDKHRWFFKFHIAHWEGRFRWGFLNTGRAGHNFKAAEEYELPVEYFKLLTDKEHMQHSAGYYVNGATTYAASQVEKLKLIASKLELKAGMTLLDVGCGFGGLAKFMADRHGVSAVGVTICESMSKAARNHCIGSKVTIKHQHWREMEGKFDRITIIEMLEHVGKQNYDEFFRKIESLLKPGGRVLLQHYAMDPGTLHFTEFICKYQFGQVYFPDFAEFVSPCSRYFRISNVQDFSLDAEGCGHHFIGMIEDNRAELEALVGPRVVRALRTSYAEALANSKIRSVMIYQTVLVGKDDRTRVPVQ